MTLRLAQMTMAFVAMASLAPYAEAADKSAMSVPRDTNIYKRPAIPEDFRPVAAPKALAPAITSIIVVDAVVNNTNPALKNDDTFGNRGEVSIGVRLLSNGAATLALTNFEEKWGTTAPLWSSKNDGLTWTKEFTINPPPGDPGAIDCPCDQTIDFTSHTGDLAGTFLTDNIFSAQSNNLKVTPGAFNYFQSPPGTAVPTTHLVPGVSPDQPWLLVGRKPGALSENVYVAYDNFSGAPDMHVAVAATKSPLNFTVDNISGFSSGGINPGHRLAVDPRSGAVYSLFQRNIGPGAGGSKNINYMLNRSTDGGRTWTLNGSATGIVVANADSDQTIPKFCTVNALLGGVDHAAVDPVTGDVVYVYGNRDRKVGANRLAMRRLTPNGTGGLTIGPEIFITGLFQAAIPSVAITANRVIGVFYYVCGFFVKGEFPKIEAHFATSTDLGNTFFDTTLESFLSPAKDSCPSMGCERQRVLGDYMQVKAVNNSFYGGFAGNRVPFYPASPVSIIDPIYFKAHVNIGRLE